MTDDQYLKRMGENISRLRNEKGFSQLDLCSRIGMEKSNLSAIENGRQNASTLTLRRIGDALDVEVVEFFKF